MFGNRNKISSEELAYIREQISKDKAFFRKLSDESEKISANYEEIAESEKVAGISTLQLEQNIGSVIDFSSNSLEQMARLNKQLADCAIAAKGNLDSLDVVAREQDKLYEDACALVEENKHLTSPSKYMAELPSTFRIRNKKYLAISEEMEKYSKNMSVLALNAAIEAGRLGDGGKQFVNAAEDIRIASTQYLDNIEMLRKEIAESDEEVARLQEEVSHLISLLKENNVAINKFMRQCATIKKDLGKCGEISADTIEGYRQQIISIKNTQEDILKYEERNKLGIEDLKSEMQTQTSDTNEITAALEKIFGESKERFTALSDMDDL